MLIEQTNQQTGEVTQVQEPGAGNGLPTWGYEDLSKRPAPEWAIWGVMQARGIGLMHGDPGTYKTFLELDMMLSMVTGEPDWMGHRIDRTRRVLYVLAEGIDFFFDRMKAWRTLHKDQDFTHFDANFRVYPGAVNILNPDHVKAVIATANAIGAEVVVFDTYSRMLTGENENDNSVVSKVVSHLDEIARGIDGFVWMVHHNSKEGKFRGSTVLEGALDVRVEVTKEPGGMVMINCRKMKNGQEFTAIRAEMVPVGNSVVPVPTSAVTHHSPVAPRGFGAPVNMNQSPF